MELSITADTVLMIMNIITSRGYKSVTNGEDYDRLKILDEYVTILSFKKNGR